MSKTGEIARLKACEALNQELYYPYTYVRDSDQFMVPEDWRSHVEAFLRGESWQDDCDGYGMTACDAALIKGLAKPEELALHACLVDLQSGRMYDHCVGSIDIGGVTYLFDCIKKGWLVKMTDVNYKWHSHMRYHGDGWYETVMT